MVPFLKDHPHIYVEQDVQVAVVDERLRANVLTRNVLFVKPFGFIVDFTIMMISIT